MEEAEVALRRPPRNTDRRAAGRPTLSQYASFRDSAGALRRSVPRDALLAAVALATLCMVPVWADLQTYLSPTYLYHFTPKFPWPILLSAFAATAILVCLWLVVLWMARRHSGFAGETCASVVFALMVVWAMSGICVQSAFRLPYSWHTLRAIGLIIPWIAGFAVLLAGLFGRLPKIAAATIRTARILSPLPLVLIANFLFLFPDHAAPRPPLNPSPKTQQARRLVLVVFDGWDAAITADERKRTPLPGLDAMERSSLRFTAAEPPTLKTVTSIPSILTGKVVQDALPTGPASVDLRFETQADPQPLQGQTHLFSALRAMGVSTAAVGWYLPYCGLFAQQLNECADMVDLHRFEREYIVEGLGVPAASARLLLDSSPARDWLYQTLRPFHSSWLEPERRVVQNVNVQIFERARKFAWRSVADPSLGFVLLHYPIPHPPGIYDATQSRLHSGSGSTYRGNLVLVDQAIAAIRRRIADAGLAGNTALIVTSDHPYRPDLWNLGVWLAGAAEADDLARHSGPYVPLLMEIPGVPAAAMTKPYPLTSLYGVVTDYFQGTLDAERLFERVLPDDTR